MLEGKFIKQADGIDVQPQILHNNRFFPYFKVCLLQISFTVLIMSFVFLFLQTLNFGYHQDCLGVSDGTHARVKVSRADAPCFRGRKDWPTQNIFVACDLHMKFIYVLAGWEGTTSDSRILKEAFIGEDPLVILEGKFKVFENS